ncbi:MAG: hypothetical protein GX567_05045 [Clostridia bacterium]|nr:hypothetical protein [Clostridia bacterium]
METYMNHTYEVKVVEGKFDFYLFFNQVERFGRNLSLSLKEINALRLLTEEVVVNHLMKHSNNITLTIIYRRPMDDDLADSIEEKDIKVMFDYDGERYNLFSADDVDDLSFILIKCLTQSEVFYYDEQNHLAIEMRQEKI